MIAVGLGAVAVSTVIIFGYLVFIWWLDRYEREPFWLVLLTFVWGAVGGTMLGCILSVLMDLPMQLLNPEIYTTIYGDIYSVVIVAPLAEEFTKGLIFVALLFTPHIDNETDGLIYGAAVGLGFAAVENLAYFATVAMTDPGSLLLVIFLRTFFTALVHTISSALLGFSIGYVRHRKLRPWLWLLPFVGFGLAVLNHALWNFLATMAGSGLLGDAEAAGVVGLGILLVAGMAVVMFGITQLSLNREQRNIKKYLADEAERGTLPPEHAAIIPYWRKRSKKGWLPPQIPQDDYIAAATLLAFRRYQRDTAAPKYHEKYEEEVEEFRAQVRAHLAKAGVHGI